MRRLLFLVAPPVFWCAYVIDFPVLYGHFGDQARLVGLGLVALTAWLWGVQGGLVNGAVGLVLSEGLVSVMHGGVFALSGLSGSDSLFKVVAFAGAGLGFGYLRNVRDQMAHHRSAFEQAQLDPLTGLLNRAGFHERLEGVLERAREEGTLVAFLFVDLDRFKFVNDTYGHEVGDALLREVGRALRDNVRDQDLVGRLGGDEFTLALLHLHDAKDASMVARNLVRALSAPISIDDRELRISASVGVSLFPRDGDTVEALTRSADTAMYEVKDGGKNSFHFSSLEMRSRVSRRLELERELRDAIANQEFELVYQPQVELASGRLVAFEALLRWTNPNLGKVSPGEFIPVAEEAGYIGKLGHWILREACFQSRAWQKAGLRPVRMAVNVSTLQFRQFGFLATIQGALADSGIDPSLLEIEITESVLAKEYELAMSTVTKLGRMGVRTALDDFGTGYSSLAYLQHLPIASLKIDQSFVMALHNAPGVDHVSAVPIVEAIVAMAHKLRKSIVAEGVETDAQRRFLQKLGVDYAQGFHFAKPLSRQRAEQLLESEERQRAPVPDTADPTPLLLLD
ncbi:MAG: EAL domain-containing protein [Deinococcales bacterium]|jgi:diguanylate cyclase (GGDEF)-like protein